MPKTLDAPVADRIRTSFAALHAEDTIEAALAGLRSDPPSERIVYFYVLDADRRVVGVVPTRRLLISPPDARVGDIQSGPVVALREDATLREAAERLTESRLLALPVVDAEGRMLGTVDVSEFSDTIYDPEAREMSPDEVFQLIGVHVSRTGSFLGSFKERFPWLLCNIAGGLVCAFISGANERILDAVIVLAFFVPLVLTLSESVSMQSMTLAIQGMGSGRPNFARLAGAVRRETMVAALLGLGCGAIVGGAAWLWKGDLATSRAIFGSIVAAMFVSALLGLVLPTLVRAAGRNPRIAAGPIVLALADLTTMLLYFGVARWSLG